MYFYYVLSILLLFLNPQKEIEHTIYIAKIDWHVGIILKVDQSALARIYALQEFVNYEYIDIGWGDADFYQSGEDFDLYLASKAILFPTPSVVRIQGYDMSVLKIADWRDYLFEIHLSSDQFEKLCNFIDDSFQIDSDSKLMVTSERFRGNVKYYSSIHKYHLFNTCNTWVARALNNSGLDVDPSNAITADQLFEELLKVGVLIKYKESK